MKRAIRPWLVLLPAAMLTACHSPSIAKPDGQVGTSSGHGTGSFGGSRSSDGLSNVVQLVVGMEHSCAVLKSGAVVCWGAAHRGQLGRGNRDGSPVPVRVAGIDDAVAISAGANDTCALHRTGHISCWGGNHSANLGDGSKEERLKPVSVLDIDDATQISMGPQTSCALRKNGTVVCWGRNLEQRANISGSDNEHIPKTIEGFGQVKQLAVGNLHICAIQGDEDELVCVGLDHAINPPSGYQALLSVVSSGHKGVTDVATGGGITCFEKDKEWRCWGSSYRGQLGLSNTDAVHAANAGPVPGIKGIKKIIAGDAGACAIDHEGAVHCWGDGDHTVRTVAGLEPVENVVLSSSSHQPHACAKTRTGAVVCWGHNASGQLGDGTMDVRELPVQVLKAESLDPVSNERKAAPTGVVFTADAIASGYDETCATRSGEVWCWGARHERILSDPARHRRHPERVPGIADAVEVVAGFGFMCARLQGGGVSCWGENDRMQLGDGSDKKRLKPVKVRGVVGAVELVAEYGGGCVLDKAGDVSCWGDRETLHKLAAAEPWRGKISSIAMGSGHLCLLLKSGKVVCQGSNAHGQLGNGEGGCKPDPNDFSCGGPRSRCKQREICEKSDVFVSVKGMGGVKALSLGGGFSCALRNSGRMWCWGASGHGSLGIGQADSAMEKLPRELETLSDVIGMTTSSNHSCALVASGVAYCWGQNVFAQIGDRTTQTRLVPTAVYGVDDAMGISAGMSHGCALRKSREVWCWGDNSDGELGVGDEQRVHMTPRPVLED